jgi:hypothetical protein
MAGIESGQGTFADRSLPFPLRVVRDSSGEIARYRKLDSFTTQALSRFAHINYRIQDITRDFRGTAYNHTSYPLSTSKEGVTEIHLVSREEYPGILRNLSATAFNLYNKYLSGSENTRAAAKEVQDIVNDLFPPRI